MKPMDSPLDPEKMSLYRLASSLSPWHWDNLSAQNCADRAEAAGASFLDGVYSLTLLGREMLIDPGVRSISYAEDSKKEPGYQRALVAAAYLAGAKPIDPSGVFISPRELPAGNGFFRGPHALPTSVVAKKFGDAPKKIHEAAALLGGMPDSGADAAVLLPALPKIALKFLVWADDAEFGPEAALLIDSRAHFHAPLDVLWALFNVAAHGLVRAADSLEG